MALRFNPPPGWPLPPGFTPEPGWQPDPSWPAQPPGWQLWVDDYQMPATAYGAGPDGPGQPWAAPSGADPYAPGQPSAVAWEPGPYSAPARQGRSGWAIASFVLGLLGSVPLGLIFGIVALRKIRRVGQTGRGLAIAGIVLSGVWLVLAGAVIGIAAATHATRSLATGQITHKGQLSVFSLAAGDCFDNPAGTTSVRSVTAIPCTQPHNAQVYAKFLLSGSNFSYPGLSQVERLAENGCNARLGGIDKSKATNDLRIHFLFPQEAAWINGRRSVSCLIVDQAGNMTSSMLKP